MFNCQFLDNYVLAGGAIYNDESSPVIRNCFISDNVAEATDSGGGGVYVKTRGLAGRGAEE